MRKWAWALLALGLVGCASGPRPMQLVTSLNDQDPRFNSPACRDARQAAANYDDHVVARAGLGLAAGLLLGPFGLIPAIIVDSNQNTHRQDLNAQIRRRCETLPGEETPAPIPASAPAAPALAEPATAPAP